MVAFADIQKTLGSKYLGERWQSLFTSFHIFLMITFQQWKARKLFSLYIENDDIFSDAGITTKNLFNFYTRFIFFAHITSVPLMFS